MPLRLFLLFLFCLLFSAAALAQEDTALPADKDPLLDPQASQSLQIDGYRIDRNFALLFGIEYGIGPLLLTSPGIVLGAYYDPVVVGLELVDSDILSAFDDLRKDGIGNVRISNTVVYAKVFIGQGFYLIGAQENRRLDLFDRGYIRYATRIQTANGYEPTQGIYDMTIETTAFTAGIGVQKFSEHLFTSFDFVRWTFPSGESYSVTDKYVNTQDPKFLASYEEDKTKRRDRWYESMRLPAAMIFTVGFVF